MRSFLAPLFAAPLLLAAPALVDAAGKDKSGQILIQGKGNKGKAGAGATATEILVSAVISATERALIGDYIKKAKVKHKGLPPGLANRRQLPPGLRKHIQRTNRLPPGLEKRGLPSDLRGLLPRRVGQDYRVVGSDIVLIETATNIILDVMQGVLR